MVTALRAADKGVLKLEYDRLCRERDRLRDARGRFSLGLGPAPASAGIATTVAATLGESPDETLLIIAMILLGMLVLVGMVYDGKPAYRQLRARPVADRYAWPPAHWRRRFTHTGKRWLRRMRDPLGRVRAKERAGEALRAARAGRLRGGLVQARNRGRARPARRTRSRQPLAPTVGPSLHPAGRAGLRADRSTPNRPLVGCGDRGAAGGGALVSDLAPVPASGAGGGTRR